MMRSREARHLDEKRIEVVDDAMAEVLRRKTPAERVAIVFRCNRRMRRAVRAGVLHQHPDWDDKAVDAEVARRMSGGTR